MGEKNYTHLKFRRQFVISSESIDCPFENTHIMVYDKYVLYAHPDLVITQLVSENKKYILLGDLFDYRNPGKDNYQILLDLIQFDFDSLLENLSVYTGRYVLIHMEQCNLRIIHDATAFRKVYYCLINGRLQLSSSPSLLAAVFSFKTTSIPSKKEYYSSDDFKRLNNSNVGSHTIYDEVIQLMPNHYLNIHTQKSERYWPNKEIKFRPVCEVAERIAEVIKGHMKAIVMRYPVMLPVTAGKDSRLLLAATKDFCNNVYYYINNENLSSESNDIKIPKKMFQKLGLEFHLLNAPSLVEEDFRKIYYANNEMASERYLPIIYNYFKYFPEKVNLPGNIATSGLAVYRSYYRVYTGKRISTIIKLGDYAFAHEYFESWLAGCFDICKKNNVTLIDLLYWEERLANWGAQTQSEKDIAQEEFNPFNSRLLIELLLAVKSKFIKPPLFILQKKTISLLWPELLKYPINPGFKDSLFKILARLGLLELIYKYRWYYNHRDEK